MTPLLWVAFLPARAAHWAGLAACWAAYVLTERTGLLNIPTCAGCGLAADHHDDTCASREGEAA